MTLLHTRRISLLLCAILTLTVFSVSAQVDNPYFMNGNATQDNCNCYTLTKDFNNQSGSVWNIYKIDLNQPIDFKFSVNLGSTDQGGADGIVFVLQPISTNIGSMGGGLGFQGVTPSIGITIDTWQNTDNNDPVYDHIAIQRNGDLNHSGNNNLAGPVTALSGNDNIEDGRWHLLHIQWDPQTKILKASMNGVERVTTTIDLIKDVFNNDPMVFWGFTGSTGGARNLQRFCTALNPGIKSLSGIETCFGKPVNFKDSSSSFGSIVKWFWDLGDGTKDTVQNPPPHLYQAPGIYDVKLNILGNNGCLSDTFTMKVTIGSDPFAKIGYLPSEICEGDPVNLLDSSSVEYGTVNKWQWNVGGTVLTGRNPVLPSGLPPGNTIVSLEVQTVEGCISPVTTISIPVKPKPAVEFSNSLVCAGEEITLTATSQTQGIPISGWIWDLGDGSKDSSGNIINHTYAAGGTYTVNLQGVAQNGCSSPVVSRAVEVYQTNAFAGNDTIVAGGQPFTLQGSGGVLYSWSPPFGLSDPSVANPVAILQDNAEYILTASTPAGCETKDTVRIRVFKGPEIYVPTAFTPNGDGLNDVLKVLPVGVTLEFFRIYDRWGKLIFSTSDHNLGWDGKISGQTPSTGNYIWIVRGKDFSNNLITKKGLVTLIR